VLGHPPGDTLPDSQPNSACEVLESRGGPGQHQLTGVTVHHVHEADVGVDGLRDQFGDPADQLGPPQVLASQPDHPAQQQVLGGHRKTPSRSANATAWERSLTPSLR
jgi:hypothetical protein